VTVTLAEFCRTLRVARCLAGIRAYTIADELDVTAAALSQWELNRAEPTDEHLRAWADLLDVEVPPGVVGITPRVARCGTRSGYNRHLDLGEPTCTACRAANTAAYHRRKEAS
jgi:transcriptional regulator with XRE-family HTH domain